MGVNFVHSHHDETYMYKPFNGGNLKLEMDHYGTIHATSLPGTEDFDVETDEVRWLSRVHTLVTRKC